MIKKIFPVFLLIGASAWAQEARKVWTLRELIDHAVSSNLTVKRSMYGVRGGEVNYLQSKMAMLPNLNASGNYGFNWGRTIDPVTNLFVEERINSINASVTSSWLLWNGFRLFYAMKQNEAELEALNHDLVRARNDVILNVITLYLNVVFNKELKRVAELQVASTREQLERTRKLAAAGSVPMGNVLSLEAQLATNELNVVQRENAYNLSLLQLKQALQLPASQPLDVADVPAGVDAEPSINKTADEIFEIAMLQMPEIQAARSRQRSAMFALRSARGNYYPRLSLNGNITTLYSSARKERILEGTTVVPTQIGYLQSNPAELVFSDVVVPQYSVREVGYQDQFRNNLGKGLGINLSIPIFNGFATRSAVQRAAISRELADISYIENENRLRQSVESAYNDAVAAAKTYESAKKQVQARDEAYRMTKQRFELGAANYVEYQVAENDLYQAQSDLLRARYDFIFRKKVLDFYQGLPLEF
ncbi:MAG: TolC family protein [Cyclobacteriaceae bacterium]|nr:TolC family protein [Cyclobacteriaceae bacterium]MCX7636312.1 TolC family protein [Cyclobacteriaceae bacterium]MDW8330889.1 TolC family protein [Cyclobacteriaceae bacterium]